MTRGSPQVIRGTGKTGCRLPKVAKRCRKRAIYPGNAPKPTRRRPWREKRPVFHMPARAIHFPEYPDEHPEMPLTVTGNRAWRRRFAGGASVLAKRYARLQACMENNQKTPIKASFYRLFCRFLGVYFQRAEIGVNGVKKVINGNLWQPIQVEKGSFVAMIVRRCAHGGHGQSEITNCRGRGSYQNGVLATVHQR